MFPKPQKRSKARKPLTRSAPIRRKRARRIDRKAPEERAWLEWLHQEKECEAARWEEEFDTFIHACMGPLEAAHLRDMTGLGRKEPDTSTILLCQEMHRCYDQARGYFAGWPRGERKAWFMRMLERTRRRYAAQRSNERT